MPRSSAVKWTLLWVALAFSFAGALRFLLPADVGPRASLEFVTGYLVEYSLSVDNLFVFLLIFHSFRVPEKYQPRVLFWGIFGAVVLRAIFVFAGTALIEAFHPALYFFGALLVFTGLKLLVSSDDDEEDLSKSKTLRFARWLLPVTETMHGSKFFVRMTAHGKSKLRATPLLLVLVVVELSDVVFAVDSIPAVFGVTTDPFIVFTSNIFAVLGLRSLFFLLAGVLHMRFLKPALGIVLAFVGGKMLLPLVPAMMRLFGYEASFPAEHDELWVVPISWSLVVIGALLAGGIGLSYAFPGEKHEEAQAS